MIPASTPVSQTAIPETVRQEIDAGSLFRIASMDREKHQWQSVINSVYALLAYRNDWDGLGSPAPDRDIVNSSIKLLSLLQRTPNFPIPSRVTATPSGTVGIEWQSHAMYLEAEVVEPAIVEWMMIENGKPPVHHTFQGKREIMGQLG